MRRVLGLMLGIGFCLRLAVAVHDGLNSSPRPGSDSAEYDTYAWNLAQGNGYRGNSPDVSEPDHLTAYRMPGTSLLWAGLYRLAGHRYDVVRIVGCVLGSLTILLVFGIGRRAFSDRVGWLAAAGYTIWPTSLLYSSQLESEGLFTALLLGYILCTLRFAAEPSARRAIAAGVVLGLAMLTRANAVFMVVLAAIWACWQFRHQRRTLLLALAIPTLAVVTLVPWTLRNYATLHAFLPFGTGGGDVLLGSNNRVVATDPVYYGYWVFPTSDLPEYHDQLTGPDNEVVRDRVEKRLAVSWLLEHPGRWPYLLLSKVRRSLTPVLEPRSPLAYRLGMLFSWGPVLLLFAAAFVPTLVRFLKAEHPGWIVHLGIVQFELTALVFWGSSRFRYPVEGLCLMLAGVSAVWMWEKLRRPAARGLR